MLSLRLFLMILVSLVCKEVIGGDPAVDWPTALIAIMGCVLGFGLLVKMMALLVLLPSAEVVMLGGSPSAAVHRRFQDLCNLVQWLWIAMIPAMMFGTGWGAWCNAWLMEGMPRIISMLLTLAPTIGVVALWEWIAAQLDGLGAERDDAIALGKWLQRLRIGEFAHLSAALVPVLLISATNDALSFFWRGAGAGTISLLAGGIGITATMLLLPTLYRISFGTRRVDAAQLANRVGRFLRRLGIGGLRVEVVSSDRRWCGAAVVGIVPGMRYLWLGDGLLSRLNDRQVDMVVLHELAHLRRRHFLWRVVPVLWAGSIPACYWFCRPGLQFPAALDWSVGAAVWGAAALVLIAGLAWFARISELDADRQACEYALQVCDWADEGRDAVAGALAEALEIATGAGMARRRSWLHPSLTERVNHLERWKRGARGAPFDAGT